MEVERCTRVLDAAVLILDSVAGVQAQTETANRHKIPRIAFCNKMDREGADFVACTKSLNTRLKGWGRGIPVQWPVSGLGKGVGGDTFSGIVDLLDMKCHEFSGPGGATVTTTSLTKDSISVSPALASTWSESVKARQALIEQLCDLDETLLEQLLSCDMDTAQLDPANLRAALRRCTIAGSCIPVFLGAAGRNIGVQMLMDAVVEYLPAPADRPFVDVTIPEGRSAGDEKRVVSLQKLQTGPALSESSCMFALAFKIIHDKNRGPLVFVRVYSGIVAPLLTFRASGVLDAKSVLINTTQNGAKERVAKVLQVYADDYEEIPYIEAGNIACLQGLRVTRTGDTLICPAKSLKGKEIHRAQLIPIRIPPPVFFCSLEAASLSEDRKLAEALSALCREDPSLSISTHPDTQQTLLGGMGELHLEISVARIREHGRVDVSVGKVMIGYRETVEISTPVTQTFTHDRDVLGKRSWASVSVQVRMIRELHELEDRELVDGDDGNIVEVNDEDIDLAVSGLEAEAVRESLVSGVSSGLLRGPFLGFPITNLKVTVVGVEGKSEATSLSAIRVAAHRAAFVATEKAAEVCDGDNLPSFGKQGRLLEPIMNVDIRIPRRFVGAVTRDIGGVLRGHIVSMEEEEGNNGADFDNSAYDSQVVNARIPLSSLMGYSTSLRGLTQGTGTFGMRVGGFGVVSKDQVDEIRF